MAEKKSASRDTIDESFDSMTPFEEEGPPSIEQVETPPVMTILKTDHSKMKTRLSALASPFKNTKGFHLGSSKRGKFLSDKEEDSDKDAREAGKSSKKNKKNKTDDEDAGVEGEEEGGVSAEEEKAKGKKKKKGARSRAGALVRRLGSLGGRRSTSKDAAAKDAGAETGERRSSGSSSLTPGSVKRQTPDGEDGLLSEPSINDESGSHYGSVEDVEPPCPENMPSPIETETEIEPPLVVKAPILEIEPPLDIAAIATTHPVSTLPFAVSAWRPKTKTPEIERPIESPSPEDAVRRRIAFVAQASIAVSEDRKEEGGEDQLNSVEGSPATRLSRMVRLARQQHNIISGERSSCESVERKEVASQERQDVTDESDYEETEESRVQPSEAGMPPFGDIIDGPDATADMGSGTSSHPAPLGGDRRERLYKILVIGELGTGKTSIIKRYVHQFFSQHYRATIGVDFALKVLNWDSNTTIRLQLWDIAGQERFGNMTRVYYKEAVGAFIVFDVTRVATFEAVVKWKQDLDSKVQLSDGSPIPCVLLANKCDHQKEGIVNTPTKMEEYCREKGFAGWYETSAKENINIEEAARSLVNKILLNDKLMTSNDARDGDKFALEGQGGSQEDPSNTKSCAC